MNTRTNIHEIEDFEAFRSRTMGWLRLVGSLKLQVSLAKETCKRGYILQKRPIILRSLLIVATPYHDTQIYLFMYLHMFMYIYEYVYIYMYIHISNILCIYIHTEIYIDNFIYMYIYISNDFLYQFIVDKRLLSWHSNTRVYLFT